MSSSGWTDWSEAQARMIRSAGQWRAPVDFDAAGPEGKLAPDGRAVIAFASNDYLGLTQHPAVIEAAHAAIDRWGTGSGAARLIVGSRPIHSELERELADWKHAEAAVLFPTGFAANLGVLTTFGGPGTFVCSDELNHASIIDGTRLARGEVAVYPHRDLDALDALLRERTEGRRALVVSDTVFSMDGDVADVDGLVELCARHDALLVLDEAHAVLGPELDEPGPVTAADRHAVEDARRARRLRRRPARAHRARRQPGPLVHLHHRDLARRRAAALAACGSCAAPRATRYGRGSGTTWTELRPGHPSPIVPVVCGDEARAVGAAHALLELGLLVPAIRPPTVPAGTSRLRIALSAAHSVDQVAGAAGRARRSRPRVTTVLLTGTETDVGKTWWGRATIDVLRAHGVAVAARKPAQSYAPDELGMTDAEILGRASGEPAETVCPRHRWYPVPMAPPMAADVLGLPAFTIAQLVSELAPTPTDPGAITIVEGAGGPRSPIAVDGDSVSVGRALGVDAVVLVAPAGLGTINAVRLAAGAFRAPDSGPTVLVALNRFDADDDLHRRNHGWLAGEGFHLVTSPAELAGALTRR